MSATQGTVETRHPIHEWCKLCRRPATLDSTCCGVEVDGTGTGYCPICKTFGPKGVSCRCIDTRLKYQYRRPCIHCKVTFYDTSMSERDPDMCQTCGELEFQIPHKVVRAFWRCRYNDFLEAVTATSNVGLNQLVQYIDLFVPKTDKFKGWKKTFAATAAKITNKRAS